MNIAIDIDGVLTDLEEFMKRRGEEYFKKTVIDETGDDLDKIFGVTHDERIKFWDDEFMNYVYNYPMRTGAKEAIQELKKNGNKIYIITARKCYPAYGMKDEEEFRQKTVDFLQNNGIEYDGLFFEPSPKLKKARELKIDVFIEDSRQNIQVLSKLIKVVIMDSTYNRGIDSENTVRVTSWAEVVSKIEQLKNTI